MFAFFDDTVVNAGQSQGIFYEVDKGNQVTFEYYLSHFQAAAKYYHYLASYNTNQPGVLTYTYYQISDSGNSATVGAQFGTDSSTLPFCPFVRIVGLTSTVQVNSCNIHITSLSSHLVWCS